MRGTPRLSCARGGGKIPGMDPHPVLPPQGTTPAADLDRTDELPVLDPGAYEAREQASRGDEQP